MMSKKAFLAVMLPLTFSTAYARTQLIPQAKLDLLLSSSNRSQFVLKNAKGTIIEKSASSLVTPENWFNLSPADGTEGVRSEEAYLIFTPKIPEEIIVAVVDSGVDVNHEDLQGKIWINKGEIANNGIDDDKNGYVDDVFGWNFIGGSKGIATMEKDDKLANGYRLKKGDNQWQVDVDTLELTREVGRMRSLKKNIEVNGEDFSTTQTAYLAQVEGQLDKLSANVKKVLKGWGIFKQRFESSSKIMKAAGLATIDLESVRNFQTSEQNVLAAKKDLLELLSSGVDEGRISRVLTHYAAEYRTFDPDFDTRLVVGDNYTDLTEKNYGNNDVTGPDSSHGTHVSGIIAADRTNAIGIKGVATNVKIMVVRAVPNGDERDKDVANAIRYAVDNGARIINMSFGKDFSPYKKLVDAAVKYAESKGVLMVHAAGNANANNDTEPNFPNRMNKTAGVEFTNWLEIGASTFEKGENLAASFSNYGKKSVDLFAPGLDILSTTPDNTYSSFSGTSMASPVTAGAAALVLSYDPKMQAPELRSLLLDTSRRYPKLMVNKIGNSKVLFSSLSTSGTIVDAFEAIKVLQ